MHHSILSITFYAVVIALACIKPSVTLKIRSTSARHVHNLSNVMKKSGLMSSVEGTIWRETANPFQRSIEIMYKFSRPHTIKVRFT